MDTKWNIIILIKYENYKQMKIVGLFVDLILQNPVNIAPERIKSL